MWIAHTCKPMAKAGLRVDIGFFNQAMRMLDEAREERPKETARFLETTRLDGLTELQLIDGQVVLWPSRRLLEFLKVEP